MEPSSETRAEGPGEAEAVMLSGGERREIRFGSTRIAVVEAFMPLYEPEPRAPYHRAHEEGFCVLEGEAEFFVDGRAQRVGAGGMVLPVGVAHRFRQVGELAARMLPTFTPRTYLDYFDEAADVAAGPGARVGRGLMPKYDTFLVG